MRSCEIVKRISEKYVDMRLGMWFAGGSEDAEMKLALPMPLLNRRIFPPSGWTFFQPQTNWPADPQGYFAGKTFDQAVAEIINHRKANPRFNLTTDPEEVAAELDLFTCFRLNFDPNFCRGGIGDAVLKKAPPSPLSLTEASGQKSASVVGVVDTYVKNVAAGIGLYLEWFGSHGPVPIEVADKRADGCLGGCPMHTNTPNVLQRFSELAAKELMSVMGILKSRKLHAKRESELGVCEACDCPMRAKVFSPVKVVLKHMRPEAKSKLWEKCWILSEEKERNAP